MELKENSKCVIYFVEKFSLNLFWFCNKNNSPDDWLSLWVTKSMCTGKPEVRPPGLQRAYYEVGLLEWGGRRERKEGF